MNREFSYRGQNHFQQLAKNTFICCKVGHFQHGGSHAFRGSIKWPFEKLQSVSLASFFEREYLLVFFMWHLINVIMDINVSCVILTALNNLRMWSTFCSGDIMTDIIFSRFTDKAIITQHKKNNSTISVYETRWGRKQVTCSSCTCKKIW